MRRRWSVLVVAVLAGALPLVGFGSADAPSAAAGSSPTWAGRTPPPQARVAAEQSLPPAASPVAAAPAGAEDAEAERSFVPAPMFGAMRESEAAFAAQLDDAVAAAATSAPVATVSAPTVPVGLIDVFDSASLNGLKPVVPGTDRRCLNRGRSCRFGAFKGIKHGTVMVEMIRAGNTATRVVVAEAYTLADYRKVIDWFATRGVKVIVHSLIWPLDGPGDGTGPAADIVNYAAAKGMVWMNAVGDTAPYGGETYYNGKYWTGPWSDADNDGWLNFSMPSQVPDETLGVYCGWVLGLRWSDWGAQRTDYDLYISDLNVRTGRSSAPRLASGYDQSRGAKPLEGGQLGALCNTDPRRGPVWDTNRDGFVNLHVRRNPRSGASPRGDVIEVAVTGWLERAHAMGSARMPFVDAASGAALAVGAYQIGQPQISWFSAVATIRAGLSKPDVMGVECVRTVTWGRCGTTTGWFGTDSAAAVAAQTVARIVRRFPNAKPWQLGALVRETADDRISSYRGDAAKGFGVPQSIAVKVPQNGPSTIELGADLRTRFVPRRIAAGVPIRYPLPGGDTGAFFGVTVSDAAAAGAVQIRPEGVIPSTEPQILLDGPGASANALVPVAPSTRGITVSSSVDADIIIERLGETTWQLQSALGQGSAFLPTSPFTLFDSQCVGAGCGLLVANTARAVRLSQVAANPAPKNVRGALVSVSVTSPAAAGTLTIDQARVRLQARPALTFRKGESRSVTTIVATTGTIYVTSTAATHAKVEVLGWFAPPGLGPAPSFAVINSYTAPSATGAGPVAAGSTAEVNVTRAVGGPLPNNLGSVIATVTATDARASGRFKVFGAPAPAVGTWASARSGGSGSATTLAYTSSGRLSTVGTSTALHHVDVHAWFTRPLPAIPIAKADRLPVTSGALPNAPIDNAMFSETGDRVVLTTTATNLGPTGPTVGAKNHYLWDRSIGVVSRLDLPDGTDVLAINRAGTDIVFITMSSLTASDTDTDWDTYLYHLDSAATTLYAQGQLSRWDISDDLRYSLEQAGERLVIRDHALGTDVSVPASLPPSSSYLSADGRTVVSRPLSEIRRWSVGDPTVTRVPDPGFQWISRNGRYSARTDGDVVYLSAIGVPGGPAITCAVGPGDYYIADDGSAVAGSWERCGQDGVKQFIGGSSAGHPRAESYSANGLGVVSAPRLSADLSSMLVTFTPNGYPPSPADTPEGVFAVDFADF